ncbi:hypothetical protein TSAR_003903, partial [Trichomalopsis sarcophagae]
SATRGFLGSLKANIATATVSEVPGFQGDDIYTDHPGHQVTRRPLPSQNSCLATLKTPALRVSTKNVALDTSESVDIAIFVFSDLENPGVTSFDKS